MIGHVEVIESWVQLAIAVVSLITALCVFDNRRRIRSHVDEWKLSQNGSFSREPPAD